MYPWVACGNAQNIQVSAVATWLPSWTDLLVRLVKPALFAEVGLCCNSVSAVGRPTGAERCGLKVELILTQRNKETKSPNTLDFDFYFSKQSL